MKLKISELFYSVQGEGRYMGVPSVFLRTFGCNFQCAGFGMPRGEKTTEVDAIIELTINSNTKPMVTYHWLQQAVTVMLVGIPSLGT
jgi:organic radical activating enzyme